MRRQPDAQQIAHPHLSLILRPSRGEPVSRGGFLRPARHRIIAKMLVRALIGILLLGFQVAAIAYARFVPSRYFCWAPYDMQTDYQVDVWVNGRKLEPREIRERYRRAARGTDNRSLQHVIDIFQQTEERYHQGDRALIAMRYLINGHIRGEWRWPPE